MCLGMLIARRDGQPLQSVRDQTLRRPSYHGGPRAVHRQLGVPARSAEQARDWVAAVRPDAGLENWSLRRSVIGDGLGAVASVPLALVFTGQSRGRAIFLSGLAAMGEQAAMTRG